MPIESGEALAVPFLKAIVLSPDRRAFLLQRRAKPGDRYHGFYELPGGRLRQGESLHEALARELREEAALELRELLGSAEPETVDRFGGRARVARPLAVVETLNAGRVIVGFYFACLADGIPRRTDEGDDHVWMTPEDAAPWWRIPAGSDPVRLGDDRELSTLDAVALRHAFPNGLLELFRR